jgi:predicted AAA+ superfamily ATPase
MKKISKKTLSLLKRQGLEADVRNKLSVAKNITTLFEAYTKEINPNKKEKIFKVLEDSMKDLESNIEHICNSFSFFEIKLKGDSY